MSYIGNASTIIVPVKSYENASSTPYVTTLTPTTYLTVTFTPAYSGYALVQYNLQAESSTATGTAKCQAQIYQDASGVGNATTITNPGNTHMYELTGLKRVAVVAGISTTIDVRVNYVTTDSQTIDSGVMTILTNLS